MTITADSGLLQNFFPAKETILFIKRRIIYVYQLADDELGAVRTFEGDIAEL